MRRLVAGIFGGFALLLAATLYLASRANEGLVDRSYYESASNEFAQRELEARERFTVQVPDRYRTGENRFFASVATAAGPVRGARVTLTAMRTEGAGQDRRYALTEGSPGRYEGALLLPRGGQWMLSLAVDAGEIRARRLWTVVAMPGDAPPPTDHVLRGTAGDREVLLEISPWPPRTMREASFSVELPGYGEGDPPRIDLSMRGMEMGWNRVILARGPGGIFHGTGVFVRCPVGRKDWEVAVTVPGSGKAVFRIAVAD